MSELAKQVSEKLTHLGFKQDYKFSAHLTLARVKFATDKQKLASFLRDNKERQFGEFEVNSFELMSSVLGPTGSKYKIIEKLELKLK